MKPLFTLKNWGLIVGFVLFTGTIIAQDDSTEDRTQFVEIDGYKYHVKVGGREHMENGIPVVVLESGFGSPLMTWDTIFNDIAKIAPVMAYERPGIGQSEWNKMEYSTLNVVQLLRKLLTKLELPPPYVLVGHSWGGVLIRTYAGHFPDEVKALAYIDPTDFAASSDHSILLEMGVDTTGSKEFEEKMYEAQMKEVQNLPAGYKDEMMYIFNFFSELNSEDRNLGISPQIPIVVFAGTNHPERITPAESENPIEKAINSVEYYKASESQRIESYTKWIFESPKGYLIVSPKAGHYFHLDEPQLVIEMIKRLIEAE